MKTIFKSLIGFILWVIAIILLILITFINYPLVKNKEGYFRSSALNLDIFANKEFRTLWNKILIVKESKYKFGKDNETLSSVLGKNIKESTLTNTGKILVKILSEKHCLDAIKQN